MNIQNYHHEGTLQGKTYSDLVHHELDPNPDKDGERKHYRYEMEYEFV
ncbi:hypothetical protein [Neobacillus sp. OS1-33]|nr:hypothetical protein [Neobacillus sp. OS1-33]WML26312.1 hypothetical protein RCG22_01300 [Neobacillus sp. OS1-33]